MVDKERIVRLVQERRADLEQVAMELHRFPEVGLHEFRASRLITDFLGREGFRVELGLAGLSTAFRASHGNGFPVVALIAEMDALPEKGHACGHNIIAAAAVGAALALRATFSPDQATIVVLGTPAEELGIGKIDMIKGGCFEEIDFAMMVHPSSKRQVMKKFLGIAKLQFVFTGKAAHAAVYPEEGINALDAVIQTFNGINALRQQLPSVARVHGIITEGGIAPNIIPERAACRFQVRADQPETLKNVLERVIACAKGAALAAGCGLEIDQDERTVAPFKLNAAFSRLYSEQLRYLELAETEAPVDRNMGSSDIGNVSWVVPTIHPHVPIGAGIKIHTEDFAQAAGSAAGMAAVLEGATALALTAASLIDDEEVRKQITAEFHKN